LGDKIKEGNIVDREGNILGKHKGYQVYTIGQRRGLELKLPRAYFVVEIRPETNEVVVGDFEELKRTRVELIDCKFIPEIENLIGKELYGKARFSSSGLIGEIEVEESKIYFVYKEKNAESAAGQHMVIYYNGKVVGGGVIK